MGPARWEDGSAEGGVRGDVAGRGGVHGGRGGGLGGERGGEEEEGGEDPENVGGNMCTSIMGSHFGKWKRSLGECSF